MLLTATGNRCEEYRNPLDNETKAPSNNSLFLYTWYTIFYSGEKIKVEDKKEILLAFLLLNLCVSLQKPSCLAKIEETSLKATRFKIGVLPLPMIMAGSHLLFVPYQSYLIDFKFNQKIGHCLLNK